MEAGASSDASDASGVAGGVCEEPCGFSSVSTSAIAVSGASSASLASRRLRGFFAAASWLRATAARNATSTSDWWTHAMMSSIVPSAGGATGDGGTAATPTGGSSAGVGGSASASRWQAATIAATWAARPSVGGTGLNPPASTRTRCRHTPRTGDGKALALRSASSSSARIWTMRGSPDRIDSSW